MPIYHFGTNISTRFEECPRVLITSYFPIHGRLIILLCLGVGLGSLAIAWLIGVPLLRKYLAHKFAEDITLTDTIPEMEEMETLRNSGSVLRQSYGTGNTAKLPVEFADEDVMEEVTEELQANFSEYTTKDYSIWSCCSPKMLQSEEQQQVLEHHERKNEHMYRNSEQFDPQTEELFSFLQILTASVSGLCQPSYFSQAYTG